MVNFSAPRATKVMSHLNNIGNQIISVYVQTVHLADLTLQSEVQWIKPNITYLLISTFQWPWGKTALAAEAV